MSRWDTDKCLPLRLLLSVIRGKIPLGREKRRREMIRAVRDIRTVPDQGFGNPFVRFSVFPVI